MARRPTKQQIYDQLFEKVTQALNTAFMTVVNDLRSKVDLPRLTSAIENGSIDNAWNALHMQTQAFDPLAEEIRNSFGEAGTTEIGFLPEVVTAEGQKVAVVRFSVRNARAERWVAEESGTLISNIIDDQRVTIRNALLDGMAQGNNPTETALDIVGRYNRQTGIREGGIIGLTAHQESYVRNARNELASGDPTLMGNYLTRSLRDHRYDGSVKEAITAGQPLSEDVIGKIEDRYRDRLLAFRGETIARTETLTALHAGKQEAYEQVIDSGLAKRQDVKKIWQSAGDARVRDSHADLDGDTVGIDEPFTSPSGAKMLYPGDTSLGAGPEEIINCRCDVEYDVDWLAGIKEEENPLDKLTTPDEGEVAPASPPEVIQPEEVGVPLEEQPVPLEAYRYIRDVNTAYEAMSREGIPIPDRETLERLATQNRIGEVPNAQLPGKLHEGSVEGLIKAWRKLEEAAKENPVLKRVFPRFADTPVIFASLPDFNDAFMLTDSVQGHTYIVANTDVRTEDFTHGSFTVAGLLGQKLPMADRVTAYFANSYIHELGHVMDYSTDFAFTRALAAELAKIDVSIKRTLFMFPEENSWAMENVSRYAASSGGPEPWAELFNMWVADDPRYPDFLRKLIETPRAPKIKPTDISYRG